MRPEKTITVNALVYLLLGWAILFGCYTRVSAVAAVDFPINDGGYFYTMVQDLLENRFALPTVTTYNNLDIPFAYPPLALYLAALINSAGIALLEVFRWLPLIFSLLTIPAFYWLARIILRDNFLAALATVIFALLPRSFEWLIMGGGLTRAPATLFYLFFVGFMLLVFRYKQRKGILPALLFGGLILLTHPERSLHAAASGALIWLYYDRSRKGTARAGIIGMGVLAISALWWGPVMAAWGPIPLLQAMSAGGNRLLFWSPMVLLNFTDESIPLVAIFSAVGFIYALSRRDWFLPVWLTFTFLADPRSAPHLVPVQISLLAAIAVSQVFFPALVGTREIRWDGFLKSSIGKAALGWVLVLVIVNAQITSSTMISSHTLSNEDRAAITWVQLNTPGDSQFLVYSNDEQPALSPILEWFPTFAKRTNVSTFQGREWLGGAESYKGYWENLEHWQACLLQNATCLTNWLLNTGAAVDYIYFSLGSASHNNSLAESMRYAMNFKIVYQTDSAVIFEVLK